MRHIRVLFKRESFEKREANIPDIIGEAVRLEHEGPNKRGILIDWHFDGHLPSLGSSDQIQEVLCNLISIRSNNGG